MKWQSLKRVPWLVLGNTAVALVFVACDVSETGHTSLQNDNHAAPSTVPVMFVQVHASDGPVSKPDSGYIDPELAKQFQFGRATDSGNIEFDLFSGFTGGGTDGSGTATSGSTNGTTTSSTGTTTDGSSTSTSTGTTTDGGSTSTSTGTTTDGGSTSTSTGTTTDGGTNAGTSSGGCDDGKDPKGFTAECGQKAREAGVASHVVHQTITKSGSVVFPPGKTVALTVASKAKVTLWVDKRAGERVPALCIRGVGQSEIDLRVHTKVGFLFYFAAGDDHLGKVQVGASGETELSMVRATGNQPLVNFNKVDGGACGPVAVIKSGNNPRVQGNCIP